MSEEAVRQTRSQKRALESEAPELMESKKGRLDGGRGGRGGGLCSILSTGEVKATIKVEVQTGDEPMDMSAPKSSVRAESRPPSPDDVIVLSDYEPSSPHANGRGHDPEEPEAQTLLGSSPEERERIMKQLKDELRLEEAKLVLLKRLRQSQIQKTTGSSSSVATPPPLVRGSNAASKGPLQVVSGRSSGGAIPPPLVRGGQQVSSKPGSQNSHIIMPPLVRGSQCLAPRAVQGLLRVVNTSLLVNVSQASGVASPVNESPASRQAAAKLALRKQLEKTLLEIPPPKPPAPQLTFMPSAANNEFIYLVGLEEVVRNLLEALAKGKQLAAPSPKDPCCCSQCKMDFTPCWRQEKSGVVTCDRCAASGQKRALKAEHTSRLKAAFVKALQQEQELEQRVLQQASHTSSSSSVVVKAEQQMKQNARVTSNQTHSRHQPTGVRGVALSPSSQIQSAVAAAALVSRPGVTMAYVNSSLTAHKSSCVERQRDYLLSMLASRPVSQATSAWK